MRVAQIDIHDDEQVRRWWEVGMVGDGFERPYAAYWSQRAAVATLRTNNLSSRQIALGCWDESEMIGMNHLVLPLLDNTHVAYIEPIVHPEHRRRGAGTALLEAGLDLCREAGRSTFIGEVNMPFVEASSSPGSTFLERHGFKRATMEIHRVLDLPIPAEFLLDLEATTSELSAGYTIVTFGDRVPDELLDGFCDLQMAFNREAPMGELDIEPEVWDEERVRSAEERFARQGRHQRRTVAIAPDGTVVALTELLASDEQPQTGWQGGTLVLREHRGHRLGMTAKLANLRRYMDDFGAVRTVHAWNAEVNGPMVAINDALGFRPVEYLAEMQRKG